MNSPIVAVIGGGQLARMLQEEASALGIHLRTLVEAADGSAAQVTVDAPVGRPDDDAAVRALVHGADAVTFEHEHQDSALLSRLQGEGVQVRPAPGALLLARDKLAMRRAVDAAGLPQPAWAEIAGTASQMRQQVLDFAAAHGWPVVLKTPRGGYDGHGVLMLDAPAELDDGEAADWISTTAAARAGHAVSGTGGGGSLGGGAVTSLLVEEAIAFTRELAVLLARRPSGQIALWPVTQSVQADGICVETISPAPDLAPEAVKEAQRIGQAIAVQADVTGVLAVEMFAVEGADGTSLYVNELAMRPHNSGHWTQDGAITSQFAQHLRAVLDLPLGATTPTAPTTVMVNVLGGARQAPADALARAMEAEPEARIHLYGKQWRPGRKLGHVTMTTTATDPEGIAAVRERLRTVVAVLRGEA
ncbi:5-(carboxyamino)imidazole ribonucleotide synthase [Actinomyces sp. MRS3W]|uniref:5-(carboxyamino)imidazole ribonucleotide synthase n=1 Tax=Actinomyces sp. MRS3W TaxID=2800796 RepID=UPI0028FDB6EA|nr:ATP-grasp domain-containing protein [Actinomyces sp. MRS3W]MDU0347781.1 ATP-grasp domain-containing protein [Actinomyces sp. MRS3W]